MKRFWYTVWYICYEKNLKRRRLISFTVFRFDLLCLRSGDNFFSLRSFPQEWNEGEAAGGEPSPPLPRDEAFFVFAFEI